MTAARNRVTLVHPRKTTTPVLGPRALEKSKPLGIRGTPPFPLKGRGKGSPSTHVGSGGSELSEYEEVTRKALALPAKQQRELLDRLALSLSSEVPGDRDLIMWATGVCEALTSALGGAGGGEINPYLSKRLLGPASVWKPVAALAEQIGFKQLSVVERQAAYQFLALIFVEHVREVSRRSGAPLSLKLAANCAANIAGVFEAAFPGYLGSGLALMPFRQYLRKRAA